MFLRPTTSDSDDQPIRPSALASDSTATNPAAAAAIAPGLAGSPKKSVKIGEAFSSTPIPAVTLKHSTTHSSQNCGVLIALAAETLAVLIMVFALTCAGSHPAGFQSSAGTRISSQPTDMNTA